MTGSGCRLKKESGQKHCLGSFFKKYFILMVQNAIIVSKDYSKTDGRISPRGMFVMPQKVGRNGDHYEK